MKRVGNLFDKVCDFDNLLLAFKKSSRAVKNKPETLKYFYSLEDNLLDLKERLLTGRYIPGTYHLFNILDPKPRTISVAPFEDRIVHHAIVNILEPIYERRFIFDSYATRKGKGTHRAIHRAQQFSWKNTFFLKTDVRKYFDSIDHNVLLDIMCSKLNDERLLTVIERITVNGGENGKGLPIGNLTSQFFANCYLDWFDHIIKDESGEKYYIRYMDDILFFSTDKEHLKDLKVFVKYTLQEELKLSLKEKATFINRVEYGIPFLGVRVFPNQIRIKKENLRRSSGRVAMREKQYVKGIITAGQLQDCINSVLGHMAQYDSLKKRRQVFG